MEWLIDLLTNQVLLSGFFGWIMAQTIKCLIYSLVNKKFTPSRLFGDGGMPSSHSSTITATALACAYADGIGSPLFGLSVVIAMITMRDAMGVRREAGRHSVVLNDIIELLKNQNPQFTFEERLKEFVGHTPLQVLFGMLLGASVATFIHFVVF